MDRQATLAQPVDMDPAPGLFSGAQVTLRMEPAPADHGVVFVRDDLNGTEVPADVRFVTKRPRRTTLKSGEAVVETVEHLLSALASAQIDNALIRLNGPEIPILDGSALPFYEAIQQAGRSELLVDTRPLIVREPITVQHEDAVIVALPSDHPGMQLLYELDYAHSAPAIGRQVFSFDTARGHYERDLAPARTFALREEAEAFVAAGQFSHVSLEDALIFDTDGPMGGKELRFTDEPVRHKTLDLIGDLYLLGRPIQGRIIARKSGHPLNHALVRRLIDQDRHHKRQDLLRHATAIDTKRLMRILPHRYPMLLVDRVLEIDGDRRALGVKNVTINEPFFEGHYPGTPIMPGVLVVEAMAQLSGVLIGQNLEHTGKLAVLLSLDRVKLRRPVSPGDQLILEAEAVKVRSRIAQMRCRAYVAEDLVAEAEVKFMLVDDDEQP